MLEETMLYAESWNVAWRKKPTGSILDDNEAVFTVIPNSYRYWAADPFLFEYKNETYLFAELYDYVLRRGIVGYCKYQNGKFSCWKPIITEDTHLSYPFIFSKDDDIYIMPESGAAKTLCIYKAINFPNQWVKEKTIRKGKILGDTTLLEVQDYNLAISYDISDPDKYHLLLLNFDDNYDTEIQTSDWKKCRPAGKFFCYHGKRFRPAQDCEEEYGKALVFYECTYENGEYIESQYKRVSATDLRFDRIMFLDGIHTYNSTEAYEVVDIKTRRLNLLNLFFRLLSKIKR